MTEAESSIVTFFPTQQIENSTHAEQNYSAISNSAKTARTPEHITEK